MTHHDHRLMAGMAFTMPVPTYDYNCRFARADGEGIERQWAAVRKYFRVIPDSTLTLCLQAKQIVFQHSPR